MIDEISKKRRLFQDISILDESLVDLCAWWWEIEKLKNWIRETEGNRDYETDLSRIQTIMTGDVGHRMMLLFPINESDEGYMNRQINELMNTLQMAQNAQRALSYLYDAKDNVVFKETRLPEECIVYLKYVHTLIEKSIEIIKGIHENVRK